MARPMQGIDRACGPWIQSHAPLLHVLLLLAPPAAPAQIEGLNRDAIDKRKLVRRITLTHHEAHVKQEVRPMQTWARQNMPPCQITCTGRVPR